MAIQLTKHQSSAYKVVFPKLVDEIIRTAEIEPTMKRLLNEIESTKRRVNALEFKVITERGGGLRLHQHAAPRNGTGRTRPP